MTVGVRALQGRVVECWTDPARLRERAELDRPGLEARRTVLRAEEMIEGDRPEPIVAGTAEVGHIECAVFRVC